MRTVLLGFCLLLACCAGRPPETIAEWEAAVEKHDKAGEKGRKIRAMVELGKLSAAAQNWERAQSLFVSAQAEFKEAGFQPGSPEADSAAEAAFLLADNRLDSGTLKQLAGPMTEQREQIQVTLDAIREARPAFLDIMQYKSANWAVAALYRIGWLYVNVADVLRKSPPPNDLPHGEDVLDAYRDAIEDFIAKFEAEGLRTWTGALELARKETVDSDWSRRLESDLKKHSPLQK